MSRIALGLLVAIALASIAASVDRQHHLELSVEPASGYSNIRAADYVGPEVCGECHGDRYRQWAGNLHRAMNRLAGEGGAVAGDFEDARLDYAGGSARFVTRGGERFMVLTDARGRTREYRVTRTIGSRYIQEYVGRERGGEELRLPFGYWITRGRWYPQQYYDSWYGPERDERGEPAIDVYDVDETPWATRCAWCHNTYPFELRLARRRGGRVASFGPERFVEAPAPRRIEIERENRLPTGELVTVGISCESCHFGGRAHAIEGQPIRFHPSAPGLRGGEALRGGRESAAAINAICAQCHSAPAPRWPGGASTRNSREALDLAAGACAGIKCTDCHDPHARGPGGGAPDRARHLAACRGCHRSIEAGHGGHRPEDASCLDCHMPRVVQGFSHTVRSHAISAVTPAQVARADAEINACGLCHRDRSARWVLESLAEEFGARLTRAAPEPGFDVDRPLGRLWLESERPIMRVTAAEAYGRAGDRSALAALLERLDDPVAYYRMRMVLALEGARGRRLERSEYDPLAPPRRRRAQIEALVLP